MLTPTQYNRVLTPISLIENVNIFTHCVILQTYNTANLKLLVNVRGEIKVKECKVKVKKSLKNRKQLSKLLIT